MAIKTSMTTEAVAIMREQWLPALRMGKYEKCVGNLHRSDGSFCAVGVLVDQFFAKTGAGRWERNVYEYENGTLEETDVFDALYDTEADDSMIPGALAKRLGLSTQLNFWPPFNENHVRMLSVTALNDHNWSFEQIADFVEKMLNGDVPQKFVTDKEYLRLWDQCRTGGKAWTEAT